MCEREISPVNKPKIICQSVRACAAGWVGRWERVRKDFWVRERFLGKREWLFLITYLYKFYDLTVSPPSLFPHIHTHTAADPISVFSPLIKSLFSSSYLLARRIMTALGALQQILFVDVSPPASLSDCSLCHDMLSLSDAYSRASTGPPGIGGPC